MLPASQTPAARVLIAGGGVAALETLLALRALPGGERLRVTLLAPRSVLEYRPFGPTEHAVAGDGHAPPTRRYALDAICRDFDADLHAGTLATVDPEQRVVRTAAGARLRYDALVVATGARRAPSPLAHPHVRLAQDDGAEPGALLRDPGVRRIAFVVPGNTGWALPLYERALATAAAALDAGRDDVGLALVTPEPAPLAVFQGFGSEMVAALLHDARVDVHTASYARAYDGAALTLAPGERTLAADRVVTLPRLAGPAIDGLPHDAAGFVHTDERGQVPGAPDVYAIGNATTFPIKQGGLATQLADHVAVAIVRSQGVDVHTLSTRPVLRAILATGDGPLYLRATISGGEGVASHAARECLWWPPRKIAARHLAPYLADRAQVAPAAAPEPGALLAS